MECSAAARGAAEVASNPPAGVDWERRSPSALNACSRDSIEGSMMAQHGEASAPILFYDGACGLCAKSVQWCLDHDRRAQLRFAPLQGPTYAALALAAKPTDLDTVVLFDEGRLHVRSDAVLRLLRHIGGGWSVLAALGRVVPRFLRDAAYRFIARRRHAWFGTADRCRLPTPGENARFLA